jgi:hypothetical protein
MTFLCYRQISTDLHHHHDGVMAAHNAPKHDFAPAWLKIPSQENPVSLVDSICMFCDKFSGYLGNPFLRLHYWISNFEHIFFPPQKPAGSKTIDSDKSARTRPNYYNRHQSYAELHRQNSFENYYDGNFILINRMTVLTFDIQICQLKPVFVIDKPLLFHACINKQLPFDFI